MNLVLSRIKETIEPTDKNLFAGEWCIYFDEESLKSVDYDVHPHRWKNRSQLRTDLIHLEKVYEKYLRILADRLNLLHSTSYDIRYWRIVVGPWLQDFIELLFDYYSVAKSIDGLEQVTSTKIYDLSWNNMIPQDITAFQCAYSKPSYIHFLLSQIIVRKTSIPYEFISDVESLDYDFSTTTDMGGLFAKVKRFIKYALSLIYSSPVVLAKYKKIAFVASYFNNEDLWSVQKLLGLLPFSYLFDPQPRDKKCNKHMRKQLIFTGGSDSFEMLLDELIPLQIPISYMENYSSYIKISTAFFPKNPDVIFTSNSYYFNEAFKIWAASSVYHNGTKLLISQHGGYGTSLWSQTLAHQVKICDKFYTWGWGSDNCKLKKMPANKLSYTKKMISYNVDGGILCAVNSDIVNYIHTQFPMPSVNQYKQYINDLLGIIQHLNCDAKKMFKFRLYHTSYNRDVLGVKGKIQQDGLSSYLDGDDLNFYDSVSNTRLVVITYNPNGTSLETLSANHPTLLYWDPSYSELNEEAGQCFSLLEDVGIYHSTIVSLANKINEIYSDIDQWWFSSDIQDAVKIFRDKYAYTVDDYLDEWVKEFGEIS